MSGDRHESASDDLVFMVTGVDENGDTHIFVTSDLPRAEARHREVKAELTDVKANWLDDASPVKPGRMHSPPGVNGL